MKVKLLQAICSIEKGTVVEVIVKGGELAVYCGCVDNHKRYTLPLSAIEHEIYEEKEEEGWE
jgi:hypothetical protein